MIYVAFRIFLALLFGFGKVFSSAGTNLFGSQKILEFFPDHPAGLEIPLKTVAFISNTHTTFFAKFFNIWFYFTRSSQQNEYKQLNFLNRKQTITLFTLIAIGYAYGAFAGLPSYIIGTTIYDFFAGKKPEEDPENISWLARALASYILFSNIFSNYSFNLKNIKSNTAKAICSLNNIYQNPTLFLNRHFVLTLVLSVMGVRAYTSYTYFATYQSLLIIPIVQKIFRSANGMNYLEPFAKSIAILAAILSLPSNTMSLVARVYYLFNQQAAPKTVKAIGIDNRFLYAWTLFIGFFDAAIQGSGSFISVVTTSQDWFGANPKAAATVIDAVLCALSAAFLYFCFTVNEAADFFRSQKSSETRQINDEAMMVSYGTLFYYKTPKKETENQARCRICCRI